MKYFFILLLSLFSFGAYADDETIEMLNKLDNESMVFSKKIVRIDVGNKVFWKATDKGHNVEFIVAPDNIKFKSKLHKSVGYKFVVPGIYTYKCTPHVSAGMVGVIVVGNDISNFDEVWNSKKYYGQAKDIIQTILERYKS